MAINAGQVTLDEAAIVDKRLQTVTRVVTDTVHNEVFCLIDPDDGSGTSTARIKNAIPASTDYGVATRETSLAPDRTQADTLSAVSNSTALAVEGYGSCGIEISGTHTGLDFRVEISVDGGTTYRDVDVYDVVTETTKITVSANGTYIVWTMGGVSHVRGRVAAITTGSVTITKRASVQPMHVHVAHDRVPGSSDPSHVVGLGASDGTNLQRLLAKTAAPAGTDRGLVVRQAGALTADQGAATGVAGAWPAKITDGTDVALVTAAGEVNVLASAQPGTDIGDVTVNNAAGASAVNVQDGGNALTVDAVDLDIRNLVPAQDEVQARDKAQFDDTAPTLPAEDAYADLRITGQRGLHVNLRNNAGTELGTSGAPVRTDPTGTTTQPVSIAAAVDVSDRAARLVGQVEGRAADGAAVAGNPVLVAGTDGTNAQTLKLDAAGEAQVDVLTLPALVAGSANIGDVDVLTMPTGASAAQVQGDVANDAVDSGNPVKIGGLASGAVPTAVAAADRVSAYHDREGRQVVRPWGAGSFTQVNFPAVNTRASSTKAAGAAGIRHVCTGITVVLAAGATAPAAIQLDVRLRDGILDTGTILWQAVISLPATAGAMNGIARQDLFIRGTAATAMTLEFSAAGGANTFESVSFEGVDITEA